MHGQRRENKTQKREEAAAGGGRKGDKHREPLIPPFFASSFLLHPHTQPPSTKDEGRGREGAFTWANVVCRRWAVSNGDIRTSRCTPASVLLHP